MENSVLKESRREEMRGIWQSVLFLAVLAAVTGSLVTACMERYVHRSDMEIALCGNGWENSRLAGKQEDRRAARVRTTGTVTVQSSAGYSDTQAAAGEAFHGLEVSDVAQVWTTRTEMELFRTAYQNRTGAVSVKGSDGSHVIAPGTGGSYRFSLKNTGKREANYKVWMETRVSAGLEELPLEARVSGAQGWLLGSREGWDVAGGLNDVVEEGHIKPGESTEYALYWQWPFEREADETDTALGGIPAEQELTYQVIIYAQAEETEDTGADGNRRGTIPARLTAPQTGDRKKPFLWMSSLLAAEAGAGYLFTRKRKKEKEGEQG